MQRFLSRAALPALVLALAACGDTPAAIETPVEQGPVRFVIVSGNDQVGAAGEELPQPIVVQAVDASGNPAPGRHVGFVVLAGGGAMFVGGGVSDASGIVKDYWTLGRLAADSQRIEARSVDPATGAKQVVGVFRATSVAGAPAGTVALTLPPNGAWTATVRSQILDSMRVALVDRFGNRLMQAGVNVQWVASHGGNVTPTNSITTTNAQGITATLWRLGSVAGPQTLSTSVNGSPAKAMFHAMAAAGAPAAVSILPDSLHVNYLSALPFTISATDAYGNAVPYALSSLTPSVVVVNQDPLLFRAVANGKARVVATAGSRADTAVVTILQQAASIVFRTPFPNTVRVGGTMPMSWYSVIRDSKNIAMTGVTNAWTSTSPAVASVAADGTVTAHTTGTFRIIVSKDGVTRETHTITVVP
ncbi:MAG TPA: hypothetical protein VE871_09175 [Longimicrobium sp.]|nr:hypothetical protein [Longimicrobium sp.]